MYSILLLCWVALISTIQAATAVPTVERAALESLFRQFNGRQWLRGGDPSSAEFWSFVSAKDPCNFYGITCETSTATQKNVVAIDLPGNALNGYITTSISAFSKLQRLDLSSNTIIGTIPSALGACTELVHLDLSGTYLMGVVPSSFGALTALKFLHLDGTKLVGKLPEGEGSSTLAAQVDNLVFPQEPGKVEVGGEALG